MHPIVFNRPLDPVALDTDSILLRVATLIADGVVSYNIIEVFINFDRFADCTLKQQLQFLDLQKDDEDLQSILPDIKKVLNSLAKIKHPGRKDIHLQQQMEKMVKAAYLFHHKEHKAKLEILNLPQMAEVWKQSLIYLYFLNGGNPERPRKPNEVKASDVLCLNDERNNPDEPPLPSGHEGASEEIFFLGPEYHRFIDEGKLAKPERSPGADAEAVGWLEPIFRFPLPGPFPGLELLSIRRELSAAAKDFGQAADNWVRYCREARDAHKGFNFYQEQVKPAIIELEKAVLANNALALMKERLGYHCQLWAGMLPVTSIWKFYEVNGSILRQTQAVLNKHINDEKFQTLWPVLSLSYLTTEGEEWLAIIPMQDETFVPEKKKWLEVD